MVKTVIVGAAGRMGKHLINNIAASGNMKLVGAIEMPASPFIGMDAGLVAGCGKLEVNITSDLAQACVNADAVINFSTSGVVEATRIAVAAGCAVVIGTTALPEADKSELKNLASRGGRIVFAPNMSIGVNLLFHLCKEAAQLLGEDYDIEVVEMHHNQKKDAPSGTAERLGEILCAARSLDYASDVRHGREGVVGARTKHEIGMHSLRGGDVVGDHTVIFATNGERIELTHKASSRDTFAKGALRAACFLMTAKPGMYDMQDVLNLK
ncbi:MAG: 4-hydroxy-tetrahydrodipicolinate reductase [Victivallaceae bacterium]